MTPYTVKPKAAITLPTVLVIAAAAFVVVYPVYLYVDTMVTGGIHDRGDLLTVDLKAMSNFEMDQNHGTSEDIPELYRKLEGKRVMLTGQMWDPYATAGRVSNFSLVYSINNCCFNGPPKVQHFVQASMLPGHHADYYADFVNVVGILHVGVKSANGHVQSVYRIDVERIEND